MYKVLAIEDDELLAQRVVCTLSAAGLSVEVARTGHAGVMRVMAGDYDAVVLDRIPDAQCGKSADSHDASRGGMGTPFRPGHQPDRCPCRTAAQENRRAGRAADDSHHPRPRLPVRLVFRAPTAPAWPDTAILKAVATAE